MRPDVERVADVMAEIARTEIMPRFNKLGRADIREKQSANDLVTVADEAAERALRAALLDIAPHADFIGEEAAASDPSITERVSRAPACWIVDPLDGTRNFVNGVVEFGMIVAYAEAGRTLAGWIYAIPKGLAFTAALGEGASFGGGRAPAAYRDSVKPVGLRSTGWLRPPWRDRIVKNLKERVASRPGACSAYAYMQLASGEIDFMLSSRVHPWDHAAGALLLAEVGGDARWLDDGEAYEPCESLDRPYLATAPGRDWRAIANSLLA